MWRERDSCMRGRLLEMSHMIKKSHIGSLKRRVMVYKSSGLLLLLPIGFRMEPHLGLLPWSLVEVGSFLESPNKWYQSRWCVRVGDKGVAWCTPWMCLVKWHIGVDRAGTRVLQRGSMAWINSWWWLDTLVKASAQGRACALMCVKETHVWGRDCWESRTWVKEVPYREFEKKGNGI